MTRNKQQENEGKYSDLNEGCEMFTTVFATPAFCSVFKTAFVDVINGKRTSW